MPIVFSRTEHIILSKNVAMAESLFDIFGEHLTRKVLKNDTRARLYSNENIGKTITSGKAVVTGKMVSSGLPIKANESVKKANEPKKSFLCNTGTALQLQSTPIQRPLSPKCRNTASKTFNSQVIYSDMDNDDYCFEELEFTKPVYKYDNFHEDLLDYYMLLQEQHPTDVITPSTPPPQTEMRTMEYDSSYDDEFFKAVDISNEEIVYENDLDLPELY